MRTTLIAIALLVAASSNMAAAQSSPLSVHDEIQQRDNREPISQGKGRCKSFAKANKCRPRFDKRISSCVCL